MRNVFAQEGRGFSCIQGSQHVPVLSAALDGLSGDIGGLCGCILHKPGVCSRRQAQAPPPNNGDMRRNT